MSLFNTKGKEEPARLYPKKEVPNYIFKLCQLRKFLVVIAIILALVLFVGICYAVVPPTDAGLMYNHLGGI